MKRSATCSGDQTLDEFLPQYWRQATANLKPKTLAEYQRLFSRLILPQFGSKKLKLITSAEIERWHLRLRKDTPVQANRALASLSAVLRLAARWGVIPVNPALGTPIAKEKPRERYLTPAEMESLKAALEALPVVEAAFLRVAMLTGARPGELASCRWSDYVGGTIELQDSKTGRARYYLSDLAREVLDGLPRDGEAIFPGVNYTLVWRKVRRMTGITARLYDLRHSFASAAVSAGMPMSTIALLLNHRNLRTTQRYAHLTTQAGEDAAKKVTEMLLRVA